MNLNNLEFVSLLVLPRYQVDWGGGPRFTILYSRKELYGLYCNSSLPPHSWIKYSTIVQHSPLQPRVEVWGRCLSPSAAVEIQSILDVVSHCLKGDVTSKCSSSEATLHLVDCYWYSETPSSSLCAVWSTHHLKLGPASKQNGVHIDVVKFFIEPIKERKEFNLKMRTSVCIFGRFHEISDSHEIGLSPKHLPS